MRLGVEVNESAAYIAALPDTGSLHATLVLQDMPKFGKHRKLSVRGGHPKDTESVYFEWPTIDLAVGDVVHLAVLPEGPGDPPTKQHTVSEASKELLTNSQLAAKLLALCEQFESSLESLMEEARALESADEFERLADAAESIASSLESDFKLPIYRRHRNLAPRQSRGSCL